MAAVSYFHRSSPMTDSEKILALEKKIEQMAHQIGVLEDIHAIRCLQHKYGYYLDKCFYNEVVDLFSESCEIYFFGGIFKGKAGARRLFCDRFGKKFAFGNNGPVHGVLMEHPQLQDVIDVAPDRRTARARFRYLEQAGRHESIGRETAQWWEGGVYENVYIKEDGIWKFQLLSPRVVWQADYETGWAHTRPQYVKFFTETYPANPEGPDAIEDPPPTLWPHTDLVPFHYPHPVTGKMVK
jgi:hypothetical protein